MERNGVTQRNYGIDLLRILSMLMVLLLHVLGAGGVLGAAEKLSLNYEVAWLLETAAYCAVNCYALISGYVGWKSKYKYANIAVLWLQVVLYSVGINVLFMILRPETWDWKTILNSLFPVINNYGWYFTCYFALFFFMPMLNHVVQTMTERDLKILCGSVVGVLSLLGTVAKQDIFQLKDGYSVLWLGALYLLGGCIGRFGWFRSVPKWKAALGYIIGVLLAWGTKFLLEAWNNPWLNEVTYSEVLIRYKSPMILLTAVSLLVLFSGIDLPKTAQAVIKFLAPAAFGVYIIHMHPQIWNRIIVGKYAGYTDGNAGLLVLKVLATAVVIYLAISLIDLIRHYLFKWLKIKERLSERERCIRERKKERA